MQIEFEKLYLNNLYERSGREIAACLPDPETVAKVEELLTPENLLLQTEFPSPEIITPGTYPHFADLLVQRERIRNLQLLPVKTDDDRTDYHQQSALTLKMVRSYVQADRFCLQTNLFPYFLPPDVEQYILWLQDFREDRCTIALELARGIQLLGKTPEEVIIFERPLKTQSRLVRGTVPQIRHIHLWLEGENPIVRGYISSLRAKVTP